MGVGSTILKNVECFLVEGEEEEKQRILPFTENCQYSSEQNKDDL
jgi:hypothetical protein